MRVLNVLRNSIYSLFSFALLAIVGFVIRKIFICYLPIEYLGLEGLFSNIVSILSLAEMGVSTVISYSLYREISNKNEQEINLLMNIYRVIYLFIGIFVAIIGIVLFFFLPVIVIDKNIPWAYVEFIYCIQLGGVLTSYFLAYKRTLFVAAQKEYISTKIDIRCSLLNSCVKSIAIVGFQSYVLYAVSSLFFNILANVLISRKLQMEYPFLHSVKITFQEIKERRFFFDIRNFLIHKLAYIIYGGIDSILVSSLLGLKTTGLLANYILIYTGTYQVLYRMLQGIIPSIGNMIYSEDKEKSYRLYCMLDFIYYNIGGYVACLYVLVLQSFVTLFFGSQFLLPDTYAIALAINLFIGIQFENAYNFRSTHGNFDNDRIYMILSAIVKLILSVFCIQQWGITGLMVGTIAGLMFIVFGRIQFVFRLILNKPMKSYLFHHVKCSGVLVAEIIILCKMFSYLTLATTYVGIIIECIMAVILLAIAQCTIFRKQQEFQDMLVYFQKIKDILLGKIKVK